MATTINKQNVVPPKIVWTTAMDISLLSNYADHSPYQAASLAERKTQWTKVCDACFSPVCNKIINNNIHIISTAAV